MALRRNLTVAGGGHKLLAASQQCLQSRSSSSAAAPRTQPKRAIPYSSAYIRLRGAVNHPAHILAMIRAVEERFGKLREFAFKRDSEVPTSYQIIGFVTFANPEDFNKVPKVAHPIKVTVNGITASSSATASLEEIQPLVDAADRLETEANPNVKTYSVRPEGEHGGEDSAESKPRTIFFTIEQALTTVSSTASYVPAPRLTETRAGLNAVGFIAWGGFAPLHPPPSDSSQDPQKHMRETLLSSQRHAARHHLKRDPPTRREPLPLQTQEQQQQSLEPEQDSPQVPQAPPMPIDWKPFSTAPGSSTAKPLNEVPIEVPSPSEFVGKIAAEKPADEILPNAAPTAPETKVDEPIKSTARVPPSMTDSERILMEIGQKASRTTIPPPPPPPPLPEPKQSILETPEVQAALAKMLAEQKAELMKHSEELVAAAVKNAAAVPSPPTPQAQPAEVKPEPRPEALKARAKIGEILAMRLAQGSTPKSPTNPPAKAPAKGEPKNVQVQAKNAPVHAKNTPVQAKNAPVQAKKVKTSAPTSPPSRQSSAPSPPRAAPAIPSTLVKDTHKVAPKTKKEKKPTTVMGKLKGMLGGWM